jgi:hypothetical protein
VGPRASLSKYEKISPPPGFDATDVIMVKRLSKIEETAVRPDSNTGKLQQTEEATNLHQPP